MIKEWYPKGSSVSGTDTSVDKQTKHDGVENLREDQQYEAIPTSVYCSNL